MRESYMGNETTTLEPIQSVERAFQLLSALSRNGEMSLAELHKELGVGKASVLRLAYTLTVNGYIDKDPTTGNYSLTLKTYQIGAGAVQHKSKLALINSTLTELHQKTGRIAQFSVEDNGMLLCLQSVGGETAFLSAYTNGGYRSPLYCTSAGKAILATKSNNQIMNDWDSYHVKPYTPNTHTNVQDLLQDIAAIRRRKYALDMEEYEFGVFCIGVVLKGNINQVIGAISISGEHMSEEDEKELSDILLPTVNNLSRMLGYISDNL